MPTIRSSQIFYLFPFVFHLLALLFAPVAMSYNVLCVINIKHFLKYVILLQLNWK